MKSKVFVLMCLLFAFMFSFAVAADPVFRVNQAGLYQVQDGKIVVVVVVDVDTPVNPVNPPDPVVVDVATAVKQLAGKVSDPDRAKVATGLAMIMTKVKELVDSGKLTTYEQISQATAYLWDAAAKHASWAPCRQLVVDRMASMAQEGAKPADYSVFLGAVEKGLNASVTQVQVSRWCEANGVDQEKLEADWKELIKVLLDLFIKYVLPLIIK